MSNLIGKTTTTKLKTEFNEMDWKKDTEVVSFLKQLHMNISKMGKQAGEAVVPS